MTLRMPVLTNVLHEAWIYQMPCLTVTAIESSAINAKLIMPPVLTSQQIQSHTLYIEVKALIAPTKKAGKRSGRENVFISHMRLVTENALTVKYVYIKGKYKISRHLRKTVNFKFAPSIGGCVPESCSLL